MNTWNLILQSNTFNFIVLVFILVGLSIALKFSTKLQNVVDGVKRQIDNSDESKQKSISELKEAQELLEKVGAEISEIDENAQKSVSLIEKSSLNQEKEIIDTLNQNTQKILNTNEQKVIQNLSKKTILASFELAKHHIIDLLDRNPEYHQKFIEDSIKELDGLKQ